MSEDRIGKPWTKEEDELLIQAVAVNGEVDNWKTIALSVPGRTNKACRKRWLHSLSPTVKKTAWTAEEDKTLLNLYAIHGTKWSVIARSIPGRTDDACSKRYREALDPSLKKDEWTSAEDERLLQVYARLGGKWGQIGQELNRSGLGCRNRWRLLQRRKAAISLQDGQLQSNPIAGPITQEPASLPATSVTSPTWISSLPGIDPTHINNIWNNRPAGYYHSIEYPPQVHGYTSTSFDSHLGPVSIPDGIRSGSSSPPPFQFSSSSLSAALSIPRPTNDVPSLNDLAPRSQHPSTSPASHHPSSIDGEPLPSFTPEPPQHDLDFEAHSSSGDNDHYEDNNMPAFDNFDDDLDGSSPRPLNCPSSSPSGPRMNEGPESGSTPQNTDLFPSSGQEQRANSVPTSASIPTQQQPSQVSPSEPAETDRPQDTPTSQLNPLRHYRTEAQKAVKTNQRGHYRQRSGPPPLLSASLTVSPDLLAYGCGHKDCWPSNATQGSSCFATGGELADHWKIDHVYAIGNSMPFRCALDGCHKAFKSLNGLQYHLQISKTHFKQALSTTITGSSETETPTPAEDAPPSKKSKNVKMHKCTRPGCMHQYRQKSGLRYHEIHGHLDNTDAAPVQLKEVPPALARKMARKGQTVSEEIRPST